MQEHAGPSRFNHLLPLKQRINCKSVTFILRIALRMRPDTHIRIQAFLISTNVNVILGVGSQGWLIRMLFALLSLLCLFFSYFPLGL